MALLTGCEANQLYMAAHTVVGVNAQVNPEQSAGWILVGYDRSFATIIPRSVEVPATANTPASQDAMATLACSTLQVQGITIKKFTEAIATGEAAKTFAKNLDTSVNGRAVKDFFSCFKNNPQDGPG